MEKLEPYFCARCQQRIQPDDRVAQGVQTVDTTTFGDKSHQTMEGPTAIVHAAHWPPEGLGWRKLYEGPLRGIRPTAT